MAAPKRAPRGTRGAPERHREEDRETASTGPSLPVDREWIQKLAHADARQPAFRVALLLLASEVPLRPLEVRRELGISRATLTRALADLEPHIERDGRTLSVGRARAAAERDTLARQRIGNALRAEGLASVAKVWLPQWLRRHRERVHELASLGSEELAAGARALSERISAKRAEGVVLRAEYALDEFTNSSVVAVADPSPGARRDGSTPTNLELRWNGASAALVALVATPADAWTEDHARRVVEAAGLDPAEAPRLLTQREAWAAELDSAAWARQAAGRTLDYLHRRGNGV